MAARARGRKGGRKPKLDTPQKVAMAKALYDSRQHSIDDICKMLRVSRATLYRALGGETGKAGANAS